MLRHFLKTQVITYASGKCFICLFTYWFCFTKSAQTVITWNSGTGRKRSSRNLKHRYFCCIYLEWLTLPKPPLVVASLLAEMWTRNVRWVLELCDLVYKSVWFVSSFMSVIGVDVDLLQIKAVADTVNKQYRYYYSEKINDYHCWHSLWNKKSTYNDTLFFSFILL